MKRYRIKEDSPGHFIIEQKCLWWWEDVSTPRHPVTAFYHKPIVSVEDARERIKGWQELEAFVPVIYAP